MDAFRHLESIIEKVQFYDAYLDGKVLKKVELLRTINEDEVPHLDASLIASLHDIESALAPFNDKTIQALYELNKIFMRSDMSIDDVHEAMLTQPSLQQYLHDLLRYSISNDQSFATTIFHYYKCFPQKPDFWQTLLKPFYSEGYPDLALVSELVTQLRRIGFDGKDIFLILGGFYYDANPIRFNAEVFNGAALVDHAHFCRLVLNITEDEDSLNEIDFVPLLERLSCYADTKNKLTLAAIENANKKESTVEKIRSFWSAFADLDNLPCLRGNPMTFLASQAQHVELSKLVIINTSEMKAVI